MENNRYRIIIVVGSTCIYHFIYIIWLTGVIGTAQAKTRSAGCAAYMAPERIEPPDPSHPDYDIRADVWSLGITLVELATGNSPYRDCQTDFEVLARVVRDDPPLLTPSATCSPELCSFVKDWSVGGRRRCCYTHPMRSTLSLPCKENSLFFGKSAGICVVFWIFGPHGRLLLRFPLVESRICRDDTLGQRGKFHIE